MDMQLLMAFLSLIIFLRYWLAVRNKNSPIYQWPLLGMVPSLVVSVSNYELHDFATRSLRRAGGTFLFKGPSFMNADYVVTSDHTNIHHIFSKNAANYEKGRHLKAAMEPVADGIFNAEGESWKFQRQLLHPLLNNPEFELHVMQTLQGRMTSTLFPVLDEAWRSGEEVDMQDVTKRFMFDTVCLLVLGVLPDTMYEKALFDIEEAVVYRHLVPECVWRLQNHFQIGKERKMIRGWKIMDQFLYGRIAVMKNQESGVGNAGATSATDLLTQIMVAKMSDNKFLRDTAFTLILAGGDTISSSLTYLIWLVANHPTVERRMIEELKHVMAMRPTTDANVDRRGRGGLFNKEELSRLVYLHAIVCETFRLYPAVPFEHKCAVNADVLPSGHPVRKNERILISIYSMGRMEEIWGKDCMEFKPERWISGRGTILHVPSFKFMTFLAGARTCSGKNMAFMKVKLLASAVLWNYKFELTNGPSLRLASSFIMSMKDGLKTRVSKRNIN